MKKETFALLENYMRSCMKDSAHDKEHIYRVLYVALAIVYSEPSADCDVLIAACLLHDIGRQEQLDDPKLCHAQVGADKAYKFLIEHDFDGQFAAHVSDCIRTHRFRKGDPPKSIEAKILFDADKIDVSGAIGIARTLIYKGEVCEPLYTLLPDGQVSDGSGDKEPSFFQEYKYKLEGLYSKFFTARGKEIAEQRRAAAVDFYNSLLSEVQNSYKDGRAILNEHVD